MEMVFKFLRILNSIRIFFKNANVNIIFEAKSTALRHQHKNPIPQQQKKKKKNQQKFYWFRIASASSLYASITYGMPETFAASSVRHITSFLEMVDMLKFLLPAINCCSPVLVF
ncbi:MAG: hypothetical protein C5S44_08405 [Candidatus Methanocomedens sp.]|nr:MAG: hypothetical protein C5S44_08405 [ANME-2 cluster archaeon]